MPREYPLTRASGWYYRGILTYDDTKKGSPNDEPYCFLIAQAAVMPCGQIQLGVCPIAAAIAERCYYASG